MPVSGTNFGRAAADYGTFRAGFPESIFDRLEAFNIGNPKQSVVDLGTGTGTLARGFALRDCTVIGVDPDVRLIEEAKRLDREADITITYVEATAETTTLDSDIADVITAGQCWHWFDRRMALVEATRVLKPKGTLVIAHFDWLPLTGNVVEATEQLIERHNPDWDMGGGLGMYPQWLPGLSVSGFHGIETFSYDVDVPYTPTAWRARIQASAGVTALDAQAASEFDSDLAALLAGEFPSEVLSVPHRVFAVIAERP